MLARCRWCHIEVQVPVTPKQLADWKAGMLIQKAMPNLTPGERELLISGTCGTCFDKMFKEDPNG